MLELRKIQFLSLVLVFVHPDHDRNILKRFCTSLRRDGWLLNEQTLYFLDYGDSLVCDAVVIMGAHKATHTDSKKIEFRGGPGAHWCIFLDAV